MLKPGDSFERYTIEAPIGQGGMGSVYRAEDTRLGRRVALKVIAERATGPSASARLLREARAAAALDHPNAVAIFDVGELDGAPYIVMELVSGHTLRTIIGDASVPLSLRIAHLADIGRALGSAHKRGLVHRDIKPENVMIRDDGMVKVLDFGIARRSAGDVDPAGPTQTPALPTLTIEGIKLGTPVYMAPEQIKGGELDGRADQFSWGVVAYELLTGKLPWRGGDALAAMASALTDPVDRASLDAASVPKPVQEVLVRALEKRSEDRFSSMEEAVRALEAAARGEAPAPRGPMKSEAPPGVTAAQRFSTDEVREVLSRAVEGQAAKQGTKLGFEDLLAVAAEVGVDPESLREASRALRAKNQPEKKAPAPETAIVRDSGLPADLAQKRDVWIRRQKRNFRRHAGVYVIVNAAILILGLVLLPFTPWWIWPMVPLLWGIGLAIHGLVAATVNEDDFTEENERMKWWLEERRRRHEERIAWGAGRRGREPEWMPDRSGRRGLKDPKDQRDSRGPQGRIAETGNPPKDKLRVESATHDTAEDEAAELEQQEAARKKGR